MSSESSSPNPLEMFIRLYRSMHADQHSAGCIAEKESESHLAIVISIDPELKPILQAICSDSPKDAIPMLEALEDANPVNSLD